MIKFCGKKPKCIFPGCDDFVLNWSIEPDYNPVDTDLCEDHHNTYLDDSGDEDNTFNKELKHSIDEWIRWKTE